VAAVSTLGVCVALGAHKLRSFSEAQVGAHSPLLLPVDPAPLEPAPVEVAADAAGTFMGIRDELLLDRMRTGDVARAKLNKGGSSISFRLEFADGSRAAFKPEQSWPQTVPRKEIAAYRINRWLGFNHVAPATQRTLHRDDLVGKLPPEAAFEATRINNEVLFDDEGFVRGELSFWIPVIVDSQLDHDDNVDNWTRWMTVGEEIPRDKVDMMAQLSSLLVFDMLTNNSDRFSGGNLMTSPDGRVLFWMDNTFGFQVEPEGHQKCRQWLQKSQKFSRKMVAALRKLSLPALRRALEPEPGLLSEAEMRSVVARRDVTLRYIDDLIRQYSQDKVLVFP
jgi:hypothetical protein